MVKTKLLYTAIKKARNSQWKKSFKPVLVSYTSKPLLKNGKASTRATGS